MEENRNQEVSEKTPDKALKGYKIIVLVLVVVLGVLSFIYFKQVRTLKEEYRIEKQELTAEITTLITDIDNIRVDNETITHNLSLERLRADSLMQALNKERSLNRQKINKLNKEITTMRAITRRYREQIDSLNQLNTRLAEENVSYRNQATSEKLRADAAEEKAGELSSILKAGAMVKARDIVLSALNSADRAVTRASRADRLRVDFVLTANELSKPGERTIYVRITGPDGYVLAGDIDSLFDFEGDKITYSASRDVDYRNTDLNVGIYYNGGGIVSGEYAVEIYMDGGKIGTVDTVLK